MLRATQTCQSDFGGISYITETFLKGYLAFRESKRWYIIIFSHVNAVYLGNGNFNIVKMLNRASHQSR